MTELTARRLGEQFVLRRRARHRLLSVIGTALLIGGFVGFGIYGDRSDGLARTGIHTTATVTQARRAGPRPFLPHIQVVFASASGEEQHVRIWVGEDDHFYVGERVEIVYDQKNPHRAQLAHDPDLGPIGFVFFIPLIAGFFMILAGIVVSGLRRETAGIHRGAPT